MCIRIYRIKLDPISTTRARGVKDRDGRLNGGFQ